MEAQPISKFTFVAEVLPQNDKTKAIMDVRKAEEDRKRIEQEQVRSH
jgi:hypothetical protein